MKERPYTLVLKDCRSASPSSNYFEVVRMKDTLFYHIGQHLSESEVEEILTNHWGSVEIVSCKECLMR